MGASSRHLWILVLLISCLVGPQHLARAELSSGVDAVRRSAEAQRDEARVEGSLWARLQAGERLEVLVTLQAPVDVTPRQLPSWQDAVARQQREVLTCAGLSMSARRTVYTHLPLLHLRLDLAGVEKLRRCRGVVFVGPDRNNRRFLAQSVPLVGADEIGSRYGLTGEGTSIAILDSGITPSYDGLGDCFGPGCKVVDGYDFADKDADPSDCDRSYRHGSNVGAIAAGLPYVDSSDAGSEPDIGEGMAPGAQLLALKVFGGSDCLDAKDSSINGALDWVVAQRSKYNIVAANLSLGYLGVSYETACDREISGSFTAAIRTVTAAGVLVVAAAGNEGQPDGVSYPACLSDVLAVANVYDTKTPIGTFAWASSDGGVLCTDRAPDESQLVCSSNGGALVGIAAPGAMITAAGVTIGGTSQAAPHVAGAAALLAQADPGASPQTLRTALVVSSVVVEDDRSAQVPSGYVYPRLNLEDVLDPDFDEDGFESGEDCNNGDASVYPGAEEICDGKDQDCDGVEDDLPDADRDGFSACADCDDTNGDVFPGQEEKKDGVDQDCDGKVDDNVPGCGCGQAEEEQFGMFPLLMGVLWQLRRRRAQKPNPTSTLTTK